MTTNEFILFGSTHILTLFLIFSISLGFSIYARGIYDEVKFSVFEKSLGYLLILNELLKPFYLNYFSPEDYIILLANAPIIKSNWIKKCLNIILKNKKISAIIPVIENNDHHPLRAKKISNGYIKGYLKTKSKMSSNRQDLEKNYFLCHNFWITRTNSIYKNAGFYPWKFMGKRVKPFIIKHSIDIHNYEDVILANHLVKKLKIN